MTSSVQPEWTQVEDVDWDNWSPQERATLLFVIEDGRVLLIRKLTGLGAGKINGPGGRIEPGESALDAAVRETLEEVCVTPVDVRHCGLLSFQFVDGYALEVHVFAAAGYTGEPRATDEALPLWAALDAMPYDEMWADDRFWFPQLIAGVSFHGRFLFDGDRLLGHHLTVPGLD